MRRAVKDRFGFFPCTWQLKAALTQLEGNDLLTLAPTGSGKTLTFWIPLLFNGDGISIVVTPLNVLGEKNVTELSLVSIPAVNLTRSSASDRTFKEIESLKFRVIITSPERILTDRRFLDLWKSKRFVNKLRSVIFDEAHCISQWSGDFRPEYADMGRLRWLLPGHIVFHAASATLPRHVLDHVKSLLQMRPERTKEIRLTNDRPNIHLVTLEMLDPLNSCHDILRIFQFNGDPPPPLFMVFCNSRKETEHLCHFARSHAPAEFRDKLLRLREIWGVFCTDAAGMGLDIRDVEIVVQWRYTPSLCTLWQRLGRAARNPSAEASGIYVVEPQYMDRQREKAEQRAAAKTAKAQQKQPQRATEPESPSTRKRHAQITRKQVRVHGRGPGLNSRDPELTRGQLSPSLACSNEGCPRCVVTVSRLCCDTCNPGSFILPIPTTSAPKQTWAPNKFKANLYRLTDADLSLTSALRDWRNAQLGHLGIPTRDNMYSSQFIMTDDLLECFMDLAHFNQLTDLSSIRAQVNWRYVDTWGAQILKLIKKHVPVTDSVEQLAATSVLRSSPMDRKKTKNWTGPDRKRTGPSVAVAPILDGTRLQSIFSTQIFQPCKNRLKPVESRTTTTLTTTFTTNNSLTSWLVTIKNLTKHVWFWAFPSSCPPKPSIHQSYPKTARPKMASGSRKQTGAQQLREFI
ncbi:P-loop containing nucleoside triphosphate hydrolase protein [Lactarius hengduanensis]|nr:P-loop containing nucleoside triphosphate hydrolase protein [Lactarius hengduanensis]